MDDGFLKKIRVAQFMPGRTRVVLEVDDLSDYDAFLLPNPYRLIIDIHGKKSKSARRKQTRPAEMKEAAATTAEVEAPPKASSPKRDEDIDNADTADASSTETSDPQDGVATPEQAKQELRAAAGKAPVTTQDVNDEAKLEPKSVIAKNGLPDLPRKVDTKRETPAPTKVIVDNDDDDNENNPPVEAHARSQPPGKSSSRNASGRKSRDLATREAKPTAGGDRSLIRALGLKITWMVPNDFKNAIAAINFGEPVVIRAPRAEISTSLSGLAGMLNGRNSQN